MSLLREIQEAAIDSTIELSTLLRKCKVLAARLGNAKFKKWVDQELNGYKSKDGVPDYRRLHVTSKGNFFGAFGSALREAPIPLTSIPKDFRTGLDVCYLAQPVAELDGALRYTEKAFKILEETYGAENPHTKIVAENLQDIRNEGAKRGGSKN